MSQEKREGEGAREREQAIRALSWAEVWTKSDIDLSDPHVRIALHDRELILRVLRSAPVASGDEQGGERWYRGAGVPIRDGVRELILYSRPFDDEPPVIVQPTGAAPLASSGDARCGCWCEALPPFPKHDGHKFGCPLFRGAVPGIAGDAGEALAKTWELDAAQYRAGTMGVLHDIRDREYCAGLCEMHARDIRALAVPRIDKRDKAHARELSPEEAAYVRGVLGLGETQPDAIQWLGSNLAECRAWLGADTYIDFDHGQLYSNGTGEHGFYRDWLVRTTYGVRIVPDSVFAALRAAAPRNESVQPVAHVGPCPYVPMCAACWVRALRSAPTEPTP